MIKICLKTFELSFEIILLRKLKSVLWQAVRLHHASSNRVLIVLGLNNGNGNIGFIVKDVVGAFGFAAGSKLALYVDFAVGERNFF